jgi:hypothetical protein
MLAAVSFALVAIQAGVHEALEKCVLFLENGRISPQNPWLCYGIGPLVIGIFPLNMKGALSTEELCPSPIG